MSHREIQRLAAIREEFLVARAAIALLERDWQNSHSDVRQLPEAEGIRFSHIRQAMTQLESTYILRLFAEFEGILRAHLNAIGRRVPYKTESLIDRTASRYHVSHDIRTDAHGIREYRNALIHHGRRVAFSVTFHYAMKALSRYLAYLPE